jgi:hypothetical protein
MRCIDLFRAIRWYVSTDMNFFRDTEVGMQQTTGRFRTQVQTVGDMSDVNLSELQSDLEGQVDRFTDLASGWTLSEITRFTIHVAQFRPLAGSSYIETPASIKVKHAVINVQNNDNQCFRWAILSAMYPATKNANRVCNYEPFVERVNWTGLKFPVTLSQIPMFERNNPNLRINVYVFVEEDMEVIPVYISKCLAREKQIDLLLLREGDKSHYVWIKKMSALVCHRSTNRSHVFICPHCIHPYTTEESFNRHLPECSQHKRQKVSLPKKDEKWLFWKSENKTEYCPYVIYADFESYLSPVQQGGGKGVVNEHIPSGFCCYTVSRDEEFCSKPVLYSGPNCMDVFFDHLLSEQRRISCILGVNYEMLPLTLEEQARYDASTVCNCCHKPYTDSNRKVRHHNHRTGQFINAMCNACNLKLKPRKRKRVWKTKMNKRSRLQERTFRKRKTNHDESDEDDQGPYKIFIPVVFHNLKNYDSHHIFRFFNSRVVEKFDENRNENSLQNVEIIALNLERFVSFELLYLRFIDSCQFLSASLESLVGSLAKSCNEPYDKFKHTRFHMGQNELLFSKGIFPYEYFDTLDKFSETSLPPKHSFYSNLSMEGITDEDYNRAQKIWRTFGCKTFKDYHDHYLKTDVLLLADVFENFREMGMKYYGLDPSHYLTLPSYSFDACLKFTGVELELLTDPEMHLFVESSIRGGISVISNRHARANNPYLKDYDSSNPHSYIFYVDANNLYGWAMSEKLPVRNFKFLSEHEVGATDFCKVPDDSRTGYIVECDLEYPESLHDSHNDYPLAPESVIVTKDMLSPYCRSFENKHIDCKKLIPNLRNKTKYVTHYRNLKLYVSLGMRVSKIHRVLSFHQEAWMKPYINFNTRKRQEAKTDFEKSLFKLMNNSTFGKTMEDVRRRRKVELVCDKLKAKKLIAKPQLEQFRIVNEDTVLIERLRAEVVLDKPIYAGFAILELSKVLMYDFHYNVIVNKYGGNARLLFTDTDSLTYIIFTDDLYKDLIPLRDTFFDTSDYPPDHILHSKVNCKVLGKMKDECAGKPAIEFVGLRSKMYSLLLDKDETNEHVKMTAKGVKRCFVTKRLRHDMYLETLRTRKVTYASFMNFRSRSHKLETVNFEKVCLSAYDDKRYVLNDGISTLAYGHFRIRDDVSCK